MCSCACVCVLRGVHLVSPVGLFKTPPVRSPCIFEIFFLWTSGLEFGEGAEEFEKALQVILMRCPHPRHHCRGKHGTGTKRQLPGVTIQIPNSE